MKRYLHEDGKYIARQISEVMVLYKDWNCDGDSYELEGIWIEWEDDGQREFISLNHINAYFTPL